MTTRNDRRDDRDKRHRAPPAEWIVGAIGLVLVVAVIVVLMREAVRNDTSPPSVSASVIGIHPQPEGYLVQIRVTNAGGTTVSALTVEGRLMNGSREVEAGEATIDYVPAHSQRKAGLFFSRDPRSLELELRPTGYQEP
ncbi:MAG: hypothetical protein ACREVN_09825 [Gammaproteobacteria bacterium]